MGPQRQQEQLPDASLTQASQPGMSWVRRVLFGTLEQADPPGWPLVSSQVQWCE